MKFAGNNLTKYKHENSNEMCRQQFNMTTAYKSVQQIIEYWKRVGDIEPR